ncbi:hypothetical protein U14_04057 [Candidatus Moduliflexus flocculans]|uniref:Uncharacterized protein n=1 Tax=Candidatus Moduliflexus flocculans TaxID=1499966 RepID=A0A0S6VZX9_9BACT|nr:hypothetical protein U14_04057 [Candidatus Moduliflexus flocculans]
MAQSVGFIVCVLLPAFVTIIAPITRVSLSYDGSVVSVSARWFVYCLLPYRVTRLAPVTGISSEFTAGQIERNRSRQVRTEDTAALIFSNQEQEMVIPISPINKNSALKKVEAFLAAPDSAGLRFWTIANWKFSLLMGGALSLLAGLYFVGIGMTIVKFGRKFVRKRK